MTGETNQICGFKNDTAAYLDGELLPPNEAAFVAHLKNCASCNRALNEQKRLLATLDSAFKHENKFELPTNFARTVAARAESNVSGLRSGNERRRALLIAAALFLSGALLGFTGRKSGFLPEAWTVLLKQILIVAEVFANFIYNLTLGAAVVSGFLTRHLTSDAGAFGFSLIALLIVSFGWLSNLLLKYHRAQIQK